MVELTVSCPGCGRKFPLNEALHQQFVTEVRKDLEQRYTKEQKTQAAEIERQKRDIERRDKNLKASEKALEEKVAVQLAERLPELKTKARKEVEAEFEVDMQEKDEKLKSQDKELVKLKKQELEFRRKNRELEDRSNNLDLEVARKMDDERKVVAEKTKTEEAERWEGKLREKDEEIKRIRRDLDHAQRVGTSGELAGEVAEITLEERLSKAFEEDRIESIGRGRSGADILQVVHGGGSILWESKDRYPNWSKEWIPKLKRDRDESKASVAILVTGIGPDSKPITGPTFDDGVVLAPPWSAVGVAALLRPQLAENTRQRRLYDKQETLQATVYAWVTSQEFQRGIHAIAENLRRLEGQVSRAKVNHAKWFKHMEVEVDRTIRSVAEFYGSAQGHAKLPDMAILSLGPGFTDGGDVPNECSGQSNDGADHKKGD